MKITTTRRTVETVQLVTQQADITDAAVHVTPYGGRQRWRPEHIRINWNRSRAGDGDWSPWTCNGGTVSGPRIKKDGSDGAQQVSRSVWTNADNPIETGIADVDDWANATRPRDDPPEPFETETEQ